MIQKNVDERINQDDLTIILIPAQEREMHAEQLNLTFNNVFFMICKLGWATAFSYTLSFQMLILSIVYREISSEEDYQAAASLIATYISVFVVLSMSPLFATSMRAGHLFGLLEKEEGLDDEFSHDEIRQQITETYRSTLILAEVVCMPIASLFLIFSGSILQQVLRQDPGVSQKVQQVTRMYAAAMPFLMARISAEMIMLAKGKNTPPMLMGGGTFLLSAFVGTSLSLGLFGLPKYGASAFIIAADVEALAAASAFTFYIGYNKDFKAFQFLHLSKPLKHFKTVFSSIIKLGASFPPSYLIEFGMNWGAMLIAANNGLISQARMGLMMQYALPVQLISTAFGQCVSQELSRKLGAEAYSNARQVSIFGLISTVICISPIAVACILVPQFQDTDRETRILACIMAFGFIFDVFRFNMLQQLRVLNDPNRSALLSSLFLITGAGLSAILSTQTRLGVLGDAMGYSIGMFLAKACLFLRWLPKVNALSDPSSLATNRNRFLSSEPVIPVAQHTENTLLLA